MQKITRTLAIAILCGALCTATAEARGRQNAEKREKTTRIQQGNVKAENYTKRIGPAARSNSNSNSHTQAKKSSVPVVVERRGSATSTSKTENHQVNGHKHTGPSAQGQTHQRPSSNQATRPSNQGRHRPSSGNHSNRPEGNHNQRPSGGHQHQAHANHNHGTNHIQHGHNHYGHGHANIHYGRPHRPHMYAPRPYYRPAPPPHTWRPSVWRSIDTILGVALGTVINASINNLVDYGYNVSGYDESAVYLSNVPMLNYTWPIANLYYDDGGLFGSEFVYSTAGYNMSRFNHVYKNLVAVYGTPYQVQNLNGGARIATWWGNDGQYITLSFAGAMANSGGLRYYTTLSFGR